MILFLRNVFINGVICCFILIIFFGCKNDKNATPLKNEKIETYYPILVKDGDTLKTGVPLKIHGDTIPLVVKYLDKIKLKQLPEKFSINSNQKRGSNPKTITLKSSSSKITPGVDNVPFPRDTILHGIKSLVIHPKPIKAKRPSYRDNAALDIKCMSLDQGLNSSYVLYTYEDSRGNIWIAYFGGGVSRYDGTEYIHFTKNEGLSSDYVWSILEDSNKNIWFNHLYGGVTKYDGNTFTQYSEGTGFLSNDVSCAIQDRDGNIWFATEGGAVKYNGTTFTNYTKRNGLIDDFLISVVEDSNGNIWFGTLNSGLSKFDGTSFTNYTMNDGLPDNRITFLMEDSKRNLWFTTNKGGVCKLEGNKLSIFKKEQGLVSNRIMCAKEDANGSMWFASYGGGISKYNGKTFFNLNKNDGLPHNEVRNILIDSKNNIWGSTEGVGVFKLNLNSFINYFERHSVSFENIHNISRDKKGNLWFGTESHGLLKYDGKSFSHYGKNQGLNIFFINEIVEDSRGNIWIATYGEGLFMFDGKTFTHYKSECGLGDDTIWAIMEDKNGDMWFGTNTAGVSKLDGKQFIRYTTSGGFSSNNISDIFQDTKGDIWFATNLGGVCKFNSETFTFYSEKEGLSNNIVWSILEGKNNKKWFATHKGLSCFDGKNFKNYTKKEGLGDNSISGIIEDDNNNIWVSTVKGLHILSDNKGEVSISKFSRSDGLKSINFHANSIEIYNDSLWLGSTNSVSVLNLKTSILKPIKAPHIQLNTILINEKFIDYNNLSNHTETLSPELLENLKQNSNIVESFYNYPKTLNLPYNFNHLNFRFSATEWNAPHDISYSFKIEGLDNEWSVPTSNNYADYRNIPPGTYTFSVKAKNKYGRWGTPFVYNFSINTPWWISIWAIFAYVLLGVLLVIIGAKFYVLRIKKKQILLEETVKKRTEVINLQKEELSKAYTNLEFERNKMELKALINQINPHFIFNALNSIQQFIISNNVKRSLDYFNKFGKLIRFSLEHSEKKFVSIQDEIEVLKNYVDLENLRFSHPVVLEFVTTGIDVYNVQIPPMFIQPIVENAIIHGFYNKENDKLIQISFKELNDHILCLVVDNGKGFKSSKSEKNNNSGLVITQKRLEAVWGERSTREPKIFIESLENNTGTKVEIKLPKKI